MRITGQPGLRRKKRRGARVHTYKQFRGITSERWPCNEHVLLFNPFKLFEITPSSASTRRWGIPALISAAKNRASKSPCIFLYFSAIQFSLNLCVCTRLRETRDIQYIIVRCVSFLSVLVRLKIVSVG